MVSSPSQQHAHASCTYLLCFPHLSFFEAACLVATALAPTVISSSSASGSRAPHWQTAKLLGDLGQEGLSIEAPSGLLDKWRLHLRVCKTSESALLQPSETYRLQVDEATTEAINPAPVHLDIEVKQKFTSVATSQAAETRTTCRKMIARF